MRFVAFLLLASCACPAGDVHRVLWREPGPVSKMDLGGTIVPGIPLPKPPFTFVKEDLGGSQPKIFVKDAGGVTWNVKFGYEVKPESFAWRIPRAVGYFVEPGFYVASGHVAHLGKLQRQSPSVKADGAFTEGRFQYRDPSLKFTSQSWNWTDNPFRGTPQLKGLEILVMLASNWDNKDSRAGPDGANTAIFSNVHGELLYSFTDWGSGMGAWGDRAGQTDWNCADYTRQSPSFVTGLHNGQVVFGFEGHIREGFQTGITRADVAWLMKYLGQITDNQLRAAVKAAGGTAAEQGCFTRAIRSRIQALQKVAAAK